MNQRMKRRQFGCLVFATAATTALGNFATKTLAQQATATDLILYGVRAVSDGGLELQSLNLTTGQIETLSNLTSGLKLRANERLSGLTLQSDGAFALATGPARSIVTGNPENLSRLTLRLTVQPTLLEIPGLARRNAVESWLATNDGRILSIVSSDQGTPPFRLAALNRQTRQISSTNELNLPPDRRFSNLTQCPDGTIYATSLARQGSTRLVQMNLQQKKLINKPQLSFNDEPLLNDLASLACSPSHQLFALADPTNQGTNSLFTVDVSTGSLTLLRQFDVEKIVFARA